MDPLQNIRMWEVQSLRIEIQASTSKRTATLTTIANEIRASECLDLERATRRGVHATDRPSEPTDRPSRPEIEGA